MGSSESPGETEIWSGIHEHFLRLVSFKSTIFSPRRTDGFRGNNDGRNLENFRSKKTPEMRRSHLENGNPKDESTPSPLCFRPDGAIGLSGHLELGLYENVCESWPFIAKKNRDF